MSNQLKRRYDIIINGGGIVGFTLLNLIQKSAHLGRCKVLLIEQAQKPSSFKQPIRNVQNDNGSLQGDEIRFSNRVSSITMASKIALKDLGVWQMVQPFAKDIKSIKVWNYDYSRKIIFTQNTTSLDKCRDETDIVFSTVENNRLSSALLDSIHTKTNAGDCVTWNMRLKNLEESLESGLIDVQIENQETSETIDASAPLILGCDGNQSKVRQLTHMSYKEIDLKKAAVVGTVKMSDSPFTSENNIAYQRFSAEKNTVAALLPLDNCYSSFVISAPIDYAKHLTDCDDDTFITEFNRLLTSNESPQNPILKFGHEIANTLYDGVHSASQLLRGSLQSVVVNPNLSLDDPPSLEYVIAGSRASFPLIFGTTSPRMTASLPGMSRSQIALLGDATHRVHPLAGQGLNLGIQDAIELVRQLEALAKAGEPLFDDTNLIAKALKRYECNRQAFVIPMSASILLMQNLFELAPSRFISMVNKCNPIKATSVKIANGCI